MEHGTTTLDAIPTISAAVANMPVCRTATNGNADASNSNPVPAAASPTTLEIVQQKFKDNEKVHSVFEAYEIKGQEHSNRLLALVSSIAGGTYAIISLAVVRTPFRASNDLVINKLFPMNATFQLILDSKGSVSQLQFDLLTSEEKTTKFYYYPIKSYEGTVDFPDFEAQIISSKMSLAGEVPTSDSVLSYNWLNDYRQVGEVKQELKKRESEYIVYKDIKIYCATWNVNNKPYCDSPLRLWLSRSEEAPDIYAIALQELETPMVAVTMNVNRPDTQWIARMLENLYPDERYEELRSVRLVGMMLTIIIRQQLRPHISRCRINSVARGVLKKLGNKGGVAVSLQLNEGNFCFVNSHLAAHMTNVEERNQDYLGIVNDLIFDDDLRRKINDHDHIFWIGDLNYRIEDMPGLQWPREDLNSYEILLQFDQLRQEMRKGKCFDGYTEGEIKFRPTYKYDLNTDIYDTDKQRPPAYCDRVMWKGARIEQLAYNSVMEIRQSDHKPVYAFFNVKVKTYDEKKYKRVHEEVLKAVDKRENDNQPQITVEKTVLDFGSVRFNELAICDFIVSNSCAMPVSFKFKDKDSPLNDICEKWLQVDPRGDSLSIDSACSIRVKLLADARSITGLLKKIRTTNWKFDFDILILHVEHGPDIFITVAGEYKPSCFGLSVETLCRTDRPLCEYNQEEVKQMMNDNSPVFRVSMPREFFLLIDYLHKQAPNVEINFQLNENTRLGPHFNLVRDWLDTWAENEFPGDTQCAAEALLMMLNLPETALLEPHVKDLLYSPNKSEAMEYIAKLTAPRRNVFMHLCMFLREGIEYGYFNMHQVAVEFGRILLRSSACSSRNDYNQRCFDFMLRFIGPETPEIVNHVHRPVHTDVMDST